MSLLAIGWEPEIRGLLTVVMAVTMLCGSIYLIMATNMGARLAFLVVLTALFGWLMLMGITWWIYGIGLKGPDPTWKEVPGRTVLQDADALYTAGVLDVRPDFPEDATFNERADLVSAQLLAQGYTILDKSDAQFGQVQAAASVFLEEEEAFVAGQFEIIEVFDVGGNRYPKIGESLDFLAFFHEPHFVVAEAAPLVQVRTEPGRAPVPAEIDENAQRQYVYMVRDAGAVRRPATVLTLGGGAIFLALCFLLHRRERFMRDNLAMPTAPAKREAVEATTAADSAEPTTPEKQPVSV
jgi:hypothetical protein